MSADPQVVERVARAIRPRDWELISVMRSLGQDFKVDKKTRHVALCWAECHQDVSLAEARSALEACGHAWLVEALTSIRDGNLKASEAREVACGALAEIGKPK